MMIKEISWHTGKEIDFLEGGGVETRSAKRGGKASYITHVNNEKEREHYMVHWKGGAIAKVYYPIEVVYGK